ncbi:HutD family protein [Caulobacter sp. RHG1]|uniref:HutD/Ves family protein n=1 Tax=Caulobacter sp. (strain RHG1) TaxID=2545762 RepID=UPI0015547787|nr:HutD family protein [Caulobacter sp. RHG1]NQE61416.1 Stresses-induced protein Ves (HutD) [Caulobacter sp. RHG1]
MTTTLLRAADRVARPWKNGGGVTREVAASPADTAFDFDFEFEFEFEFDWRVSIAEVSSSGPFSRFSEVDRILTVLDGALRLSIAGRPPVTLDAASGPFAFKGDEACEAELIAPVVDLNVMVRRGAASANVHLQSDGLLAFPASTTLLIARSPAVLGSLTLAPLDAVRIDGPDAEALAFSGSAWRVTIEADR